MLKCMSVCTNYLKTPAPTLLFNKVDLLRQQTRNTFILKRKFPVGLHKKHGRPHPLKSRHFVYELVEDTETKKQEQIKVILVKDVESYGNAGDMVTVPGIKAYEQLILPKLAIYASQENIEKYTPKDLSGGKKVISHTAITEKFLSTLDLTVTMSLDNEWTIEKKHIRISFRKAGVHVPEDAITTMPCKPIHGPDLNLEGKLFYVTVKINDTVSVKVKCRVHHYTNDINRCIIPEIEPWRLPIQAIFPEDQEVLENMPVHPLLLQEAAVADKKPRI